MLVCSPAVEYETKGEKRGQETRIHAEMHERRRKRVNWSLFLRNGQRERILLTPTTFWAKSAWKFWHLPRNSAAEQSYWRACSRGPRKCSPLLPVGIPCDGNTHATIGSIRRAVHGEAFGDGSFERWGVDNCIEPMHFLTSRSHIKHVCEYLH